jgi:hypothetical protein
LFGTKDYVVVVVVVVVVGGGGGGGGGGVHNLRAQGIGVILASILPRMSSFMGCS